MDRLAALAVKRINVLLGLAFAAVLAAAAYRHADAGGRGWLPECGIGAVVCVAALLREHNRLVAVSVGLSVAAAAVLASGVGYLTEQPGVAASLALAVLAGSAVRVLPSWRAAAVAAVGLAVTALGRLATTALGRLATTSHFHVGVQGRLAGLGTGLVLRLLGHRRQTAVEAVRRDERLALARELHDVVAHQASGIVMHTHAAQIMLRKQPDHLGTALADIESSGTQAMDAMRRVVALLRDTEDGAAVTAGPEQLIDLVRRFEEHGPAVDLRLPAGAPTWPPVVTATVYRVVQESLTNIARHARAATVTISQDGTDITVEIGDDAPPHPPIQRTVATDLGVSMPDGSFTVIIGPNACGKSTLLKALARMPRPRAGSVYLDGELISTYRSKEVARRLGLLPQSSIPPAGITVGDLVARGRAPRATRRSSPSRCG